LKFDLPIDNYVSTVIIKADEAAINNLHTNPTDKTLKVLGAQVIYVEYVKNK